MCDLLAFTCVPANIAYYVLFEFMLVSAIFLQYETNFKMRTLTFVQHEAAWNTYGHHRSSCIFSFKLLLTCPILYKAPFLIFLGKSRLSFMYSVPSLRAKSLPFVLTSRSPWYVQTKWSISSVCKWSKTAWYSTCATKWLVGFTFFIACPWNSLWYLFDERILPRFRRTLRHVWWPLIRTRN